MDTNKGHDVTIEPGSDFRPRTVIITMLIIAAIVGAMWVWGHYHDSDDVGSSAKPTMEAEIAQVPVVLQALSLSWEYGVDVEEYSAIRLSGPYVPQGATEVPELRRQCDLFDEETAPQGCRDGYQVIFTYDILIWHYVFTDWTTGTGCCPEPQEIELDDNQRLDPVSKHYEIYVVQAQLPDGTTSIVEVHSETWAGLFLGQMAHCFDDTVCDYIWPIEPEVINSSIEPTI